MRMRMVRHSPGKSICVLVSGVVGLILVALAIGLPTGPLEASGSSGTLMVTQAELDRGRLRVEGEDANQNATITVRSSASEATGESDAQGRFRVEADGFDSVSCQVTVSDGTRSQVVSLDRCDPTAAPPPNPAPGGRGFASLDLDPTGAISGVTGEAELRLRIRDQDERFRARATAEGEGLVEGVFFSLCVDDLFIDAAEAEELVEEEESGGIPVEEEEEAVEVGVDLGGELAEAPFLTLKGLTVTIWEGKDTCSGTAVLIGTVGTVE